MRILFSEMSTLKNVDLAGNYSKQMPYIFFYEFAALLKEGKKSVGCSMCSFQVEINKIKNSLKLQSHQFNHCLL